MRRLRRFGRREGVAIFALLLSMLFAAIAAAAGGHSGEPDARFGKGGRVVVPLPGAMAPSRFGPIAAGAGGRLLVAYVSESDREYWSTVIERREASGAPDPSFGKGGSVTVRDRSPRSPKIHPAASSTAATERSGGSSRTAQRTRLSLPALPAPVEISARRRSASTRRGESSSVAGSPPALATTRMRAKRRSCASSRDGRRDRSFNSSGVLYPA